MEGAPPDVEAAMAKDDLLSALHLLHQHIAAAKVRPPSPSAIFALHFVPCALKPVRCHPSVFASSFSRKEHDSGHWLFKGI